MVIKKKDSEHHLEEISIYVEAKNTDKAKKLLKELIGWTILKTYNTFLRAEIREDLLGKNNIRAIIKSNHKNEFDLYVKEKNKDSSIDVINKQKEWIKIKSFGNYYNANFAKLKLERKKIDVSLISRKDSSFFLGEYDLYVDDFMVDKAKELLNEV